MTRLLRRLRYLLRRDRHERELDDELRFHLDMKQQELEEIGVDRATAAATARRALGNLPLTRDNVRDVWIAPWLRSAAQDVLLRGTSPAERTRVHARRRRGARRRDGVDRRHVHGGERHHVRVASR